LPPLPPGHGYRIVVRQLAPGLRVRTVLPQNSSIPVPDLDAICHALFNIMWRGEGRRGDPISATEVLDLAEQRASPAELVQLRRLRGG